MPNYFDRMPNFMRSDLRSTYVEYSNFCIKGEMVTHVNITLVDYVKKLVLLLDLPPKGTRVQSSVYFNRRDAFIPQVL
jgi:hypothetical protein